MLKFLLSLNFRTKGGGDQHRSGLTRGCNAGGGVAAGVRVVTDRRLGEGDPKMDRHLDSSCLFDQTRNGRSKNPCSSSMYLNF